MNFSYKLYIMHIMKKHKIRPNANVIECLEENVAYAQKMIVKKVKILNCLTATLEYIKRKFVLVSTTISIFCFYLNFVQLV